MSTIPIIDQPASSGHEHTDGYFTVRLSLSFLRGPQQGKYHTISILMYVGKYVCMYVWWKDILIPLSIP